MSYYLLTIFPRTNYGPSGPCTLPRLRRHGKASRLSAPELIRHWLLLTMQIYLSVPGFSWGLIIFNSGISLKSSTYYILSFASPV